MRPCCKRKNEEPVTERNKKFSPGFAIWEANVPKDFFDLGESTFVYTSTFLGKVRLHIRRFKKHGKKLYPTSEGVALLPRCANYIINRTVLPLNSKEDFGGTLPLEDKLRIQTTDFENFTLFRLKNEQAGGAVSSKITLSALQWMEMMKRHAEIFDSTLDLIYGLIDFIKVYKSYDERDLDESLPQSLDTSLGMQCVSEFLQKAASDCIKEEGNYKDPEILAEEVWGNGEDTFNTAALTVEPQDIAERFYYKLWENKDFLRLGKPAEYITIQFLKSVQLQTVLREVRNILCPANAFECLEDVSNHYEYL